jgi:hypothetical protein
MNASLLTETPDALSPPNRDAMLINSGAISSHTQYRARTAGVGWIVRRQSSWGYSCPPAITDYAAALPVL